MKYTIHNQCHNFSAWAASRAASVIGCRFAVKQGKALLESIGFGPNLNSPAKLKSSSITAVLIALVTLFLVGCGTSPFSSIKPGLNLGAVVALEQVEQLAADGKIDEALKKSSVALILVEKRKGNEDMGDIVGAIKYIPR
jgi:hypothetical protein